MTRNISEVGGVLKQRRGSGSPEECFKECRKNIRVLIRVASKLNPPNVAEIISGLNHAINAVNDAEKTILEKYCS